jgi:hypothetical protein
MRIVLALVLPLLLAAQSALLEIKVVEAGGGAYAPGSHTPGLTVEITNELGRPVPGAVVSVRLPDDGAGGSFANGLSSEIMTTGTNGRATTSPVRWNYVAGAVEIRITAVKGQLRAGTVVNRTLSDSVRAKGSAPPPPAPVIRRGVPVKWLLIGLGTAAAAAGVGIACIHSGKGGSGSTANSGTSGNVQIGTPVIGFLKR